MTRAWKIVFMCKKRRRQKRSRHSKEMAELRLARGSRFLPHALRLKRRHKKELELRFGSSSEWAMKLRDCLLPLPRHFVGRLPPAGAGSGDPAYNDGSWTVSYTHLRAHE